MTFPLTHPGARIFVPDGADPLAALARTTHLAIGAHADDVEFMAWAPIIHCHGRDDAWFTAVVVSDGRGSPRDGAYAGTTDDQMRETRFKEQCEAARLGRYSAVLCLDFPSSLIRTPGEATLRREVAAIVRACGAGEVYTHSLADRHDTHTAIAVAVVDALRGVGPEHHPTGLFGCEVWGALDWLPDADKVTFDVSSGLSLMESLMAVFASQIEGGKRYDLATIGRKRANATYLRSHEVDVAAALDYALDMTSLLREPSLTVRAFMQACVERFGREMDLRLERYSEWKS